MSLHDPSQNGPKFVTSALISHTFITHVNANRIVMWVTLQNMQVGTLSRLRFCRSSWGWRNIMRFWKSWICSNNSGCVRSKPQFHTVQQNQKSSLWTLVCGIWSFWSLETRLRTMEWGKPVVGRDASEPGHHRVVESTLLRMGRWQSFVFWEWKSDELMDDRMGKLVFCPQARTHEFQSSTSFWRKITRERRNRCLPSRRAQQFIIRFVEEKGTNIPVLHWFDSSGGNLAPPSLRTQSHWSHFTG